MYKTIDYKICHVFSSVAQKKIIFGQSKYSNLLTFPEVFTIIQFDDVIPSPSLADEFCKIRKSIFVIAYSKKLDPKP